MHSRKRPRGGTTGFSLVEVLAAMTVLSVMVLLVSRLFTDSTNAWKAGMSRAENCLNARTSLEFMSRELSQALADDILTLVVETATQPDLYGTRASDAISFVSLNHLAECRDSGRNPYRDVQQIRYGVQDAGDGRYLLRRYVTENESVQYFSCYQTPTWWSSMSNAYPNTIGENVARFKVYAFDSLGVYQPSYNSKTHGPPLWIDLVLQVLDARDAVRINTLSGGREDYIRRRTQTFTTRVYLRNSAGYARR